MSCFAFGRGKVHEYIEPIETYEEPEDVLERWKLLAKEDVHRSGVLRRSLKTQYRYCFEANRSLQRAKDAQDWQLAYFHFQRLTNASFENRLYTDSRENRKYWKSARKLKNYIETALGNAEVLKNHIVEECKGNSDKQDKVLVKVKTTQREEISQPVEGAKPVSRSKFRHHIIAGDGHCAFRAICQGLSGGTISEKCESQGVSNLRQQVGSLLQQYRREKTVMGISLEELIKGEIGEKALFEDYVRKMKVNAYAGEVELMLISKALGIRINVYQLAGRKYQVISSYGDKGKCVNLLFQTGRTEAGNHYDLLIPTPVSS